MMTTTFTKTDALLAPLNRADAPGGVVAASLGGQSLLRRAFGLASVEHGVANRLHTRFPIGSITKHFTSALLLALCDDGLMSLDDPIGRWLPELRGATGAPTLRQLTEHTGGQRCYLDIAFCDGFGMQPAGAGLAAQARQSDMNFTPGCGQRYSNGGYMLLSLAIERASGQPFEDLLRTRLLEPRGMYDTEGVRADAPLRTGLAAGHVPWPGGGWLRGLNVSEERLGDGCMISTTDDLLRWTADLRGSALLGRLASPALLRGDWQSPYGMGLRAETRRGIALVGHGGGVMGANSYFLTVPAHELDVAVLCNGPASARALAMAVVDDALAACLQEALPPPRSDPHAQLLGFWRSGDGGQVLEFGDVGGVLGLGFLGAPPAPILETRTGLDAGCLPFAMPTATDEFRFQYAGDALLVIDAGRVERFERFEPDPATVPPGLQGRYRSEDALADLTVEVQAGRITLLGRGAYGHNRFSARPLAADLLVLGHGLMPWSAVARLERQGAQVEAIHVATGRTKRLSFVRVG